MRRILYVYTYVTRERWTQERACCIITGIGLFPSLPSSLWDPRVTFPKWALNAAADPLHYSEQSTTYRAGAIVKEKREQKL